MSFDRIPLFQIKTDLKVSSLTVDPGPILTNKTGTTAPASTSSAPLTATTNSSTSNNLIDLTILPPKLTHGTPDDLIPLFVHKVTGEIIGLPER